MAFDIGCPRGQAGDEEEQGPALVERGILDSASGGFVALPLSLSLDDGTLPPGDEKPRTGPRTSKVVR